MEQPMEDDEIVQTSDVEEREAIDAGSSLYWPSSPLVHQRGAHTHGTLAMVALSTPLSKSVVRIPEHMLEPPRKRRRISPQPDDADSALLSFSFQKQMTVTPSPHKHRHYDNHLSPATGSGSSNPSHLTEDPDLSQDPLLLSPVPPTATSALALGRVSSGPPSSTEQGQSSQDNQHHAVLSEPPGLSPPPEFRSASVDPLSLFKSPLSMTDRHHVNQNTQDLMVFSPSTMRSLDANPLDSPKGLTSPNHSSSAPSPIPGPAPGGDDCASLDSPTPHLVAGTGDPVSPPTPTPSRPVQGNPIDLAAEYVDERRYPMRERRPQQLRPYAYDNQEYRRTLKANPEAVIRVVSPTRRASTGNRLDASERPEEALQYQLAEWQQPDDYDEMVTRPSLPHRRRHIAERNIELDNEENSVWYPNNLRRGLDSDSDDDDDNEELRQIRREARVAKKELKKKEAEEKLRRKAEQQRRLDDARQHYKQTSKRKHRNNNPAEQPRTSISPSRSNHDINHDEHGFVSRDHVEISSSPPGARANRDVSLPYQSENEADHNWNTPNRDFDLSPVNDHQPSPSVGDSPAADTQQVGSSHLSDSSGEDVVLDRKRLRALRRMVPNVMINRDLGRERPQLRFKKTGNRRDSDGLSDTPLPGQSRLRRGDPTRLREVKGDSESSESDEQSGSRTSSPRSYRELSVDVGTRSITSVSPVRQDMVEISSDHKASDSSSDEDVYDDSIGQWFEKNAPGPKRKAAPRRGERSLVDYMLTSSKSVGGPRPQSKRERRPKRAGNGDHYARSIVTKAGKSGAKKTHKISKTSTSRRNLARTHNRTDHDRAEIRDQSSQSEPERDFDYAMVEDVVDEEGKIRAVHGKEKKRKRLRRDGRGKLYVFTSAGARITSGVSSRLNHQPEDFIHVDVDDDDFHHAIAPAAVGRRRAAGEFGHLQAHIPQYFEPMMRDDSPPSALYQHAWDHPANVKVTDRVPQRVKCDFGIPFLPSGLVFTPNTYLGSGLLFDLVKCLNDKDYAELLVTYRWQDLELIPGMEEHQFLSAYSNACERFGSMHEGEDFSSLEKYIHIGCKYATHFLRNSSSEQLPILKTSILDFISKLTSVSSHDALSSTSKTIDVVAISALWCTVELLTRLREVDCKDPSLVDKTAKYISDLVLRLEKHGLVNAVQAVQETPLDCSIASQRVAQTCVQLVHVSKAIDDTLNQENSLWKIVGKLFQSETEGPASSFKTSERVWRAIFSFCALSQFSVNGVSTPSCSLSSSWALVALALKQIRLTADPKLDVGLSERTLKKRDQYIHLITLRCFTLWSRWKWRLDDALAMFSQLVEIFKSRRFHNLGGEESQFPAFLLRSDLGLVSQQRPGDTAFDVFLKLLIHAAKDSHPAGDESATLPPKLIKLLSLSIPVGSVPFTKEQPPSNSEKSMLINRLSAVAVAIYLDPSPASIRHRINIARRYVSFKDADDETRMTCIRGLRNFGIVMQHRRLPLTEVHTWLSEMVEVLLQEAKTLLPPVKDINSTLSIPQQRLGFTIQVLLGSVRHILQTPTMTLPRKQPSYPDPLLLSGAWVMEIIPKSQLLTFYQASEQMLLLIQGFLDARAAALPGPRRPRRAPIDDTQEESQESYLFDLDLTSYGSELPDDSQTTEWKIKDKTVEKLLVDARLIDHIYSLICRHVSLASQRAEAALKGESADELDVDDELFDVDRWIDCWVGCANIVVQQGGRGWDSWLYVGKQSWDSIPDHTWRRRIGLRFVFMMLKVDPMCYENQTQQEKCLEILLEALVAPQITLEHEYAALLFSIDNLQHMLFRGMSNLHKGEDGDYHISKDELQWYRNGFLSTMFTNLARSRKDENDGTPGLTYMNEKAIMAVIKMFSAMLYSIQGTEPNAPYRLFCTKVVRDLISHPLLATEPRLLRTWIIPAKESLSMKDE